MIRIVIILLLCIALTYQITENRYLKSQYQINDCHSSKSHPLIRSYKTSTEITCIYIDVPAYRQLIETKELILSGKRKSWLEKILSQHTSLM